jgi:hypothetical protein
MTTLKQPSPANQELVTEWARQYTSGEIDAGYWQWYCGGAALTNTSSFHAANNAH